MKNKFGLVCSLLTAFCALLLSGCNSENNTEAGNTTGVGSKTESASYSYSFSYNGCETGRRQFTSKAAYCAGLTDHQLNNGCALSIRREKYLATCGNDFRETNTGRTEDQPTPTPTATSTPVNPAPRPTPTPTPLPEEPAVVLELRAAGIEVEVDQPNYSFPGEAPFKARLAHFWKTLEAVKEELIARKELFRALDISVYTTYRSAYRHLTLDVDLTARDILFYLPLVDRRVAWENRVGISLDFGIEIYGHEQDRLAGIDEKVVVLELREKELARLRSMITQIKFDSNSSYYNLYSHELKVDQDEWKRALEGAISLLTPMVPFFDFAARQGITITGDFDVDKDPTGFQAVLETLMTRTEALKTLVKAKVLQKMEFSASTSETWLLGGVLRVATQSPGLGMLGRILDTLATQYTIAEELQLPVKSSLDLDERYLEVVSRLKSRLAAIKRKKNSIKVIELTTWTSFSYGTLYIGDDGTLADLDKVLAQIP